MNPNQDHPIQLTLPLSVVNMCLASLHQQPYAQVAGAVAMIEQQAQEQLKKVVAPKAPNEPKAPAAPNRAARRAKTPKAS